MPGRHARPPQHPGRRRAAALAAGLGVVLLAVAGLIWITGEQPTRATPVANQAPAGGAAAPDRNSPPAALVACADALQRGDAVVLAADSSRDHWGSHVRAQADYDSGAISQQQMLDIFAATRAAGPADLAAYEAAEAQYAPVSSGCAGLDPNGVGPRWQPVAAQCRQRASEQVSALQAGAAVVADWRAHVAMMQNKPHTDPDAYGQMWRQMVTAAPPHLNGFTDARDALSQQPPCQPTGG